MVLVGESKKCPRCGISSPTVGLYSMSITVQGPVGFVPAPSPNVWQMTACAHCAWAQLHQVACRVDAQTFSPESQALPGFDDGAN